MEHTSSVKNLYCVEYPGNVQNEERMIQTLGGIDKISNAFAHNGRKLECRFRPEDKFCKGTFGDKNKSSNFLMKVNIKRTKTRKEDGTYDEKVEYIPTVIGKVKQIFKFTNLDDFQYLPIEKNENGEHVSLHESLVPTSIEPITWLLDDQIPPFLPPACFARIDSVQSYLTSKASDDPHSVIGRTRDRRSNYVKFVSHDCEDVPDSPSTNTLRYIKLKFVTEEQILKIKELFETRPVWTKSALCNITKFSEVQLKYLLALSAYHFTSGPFRIAWVRFGYDPRKDPSTRKYQIIDYRTRGKVQVLLEKRFPNRYLPKNRIKNKFKEENSTPQEKVTDDSTYIFKRGYFPPHRQMFYQLCDIEIPEVQKKLENFPESTYDMKSGWLTEEFCDEVRKTIDRCILEELSSENDDKAADGNESIELAENITIDESFNNKSDDEFSLTDDDLDFEDEDDIRDPTG